MPKIKNTQKGALVLHSGFSEPVTLNAETSIEVKSEVLFNPEIQRLVSAGILQVIEDKTTKSTQKTTTKTTKSKTKKTATKDKTKKSKGK